MPSPEPNVENRYADIEFRVGSLKLGATTLSATEVGFVDGVTAGTGLASKAAVLDSSGNFMMPATGLFGLSRAALAAAGAGSDATDAAVIATQIVAVTASDATKGVALPAAAVTLGPILVINTVNTAAATLKVWPVSAGNDAINGGSANAAFVMGPGQAAWFIPTSATQWYVMAAAAFSPVSGVAGLYKIARSAAPVALDGSNPTSVAHGLTTAIAAFAQLSGTAAPGDATAVLSVAINGANLDVYGWMPISGTDPTLVASTGTENFHWFAIGV